MEIKLCGAHVTESHRAKAGGGWFTVTDCFYATLSLPFTGVSLRWSVLHLAEKLAQLKFGAAV